MRIKFLTILFVLLFSCNAFADLTVKQYLEMKTPGAKIFIDYYITGLGEGFLWADVQLLHNKQRQLFCIPRNLKPTTNDYLNILDGEIAKMKGLEGLAETPIGLLFLRGLIRTFPCKDH